MAILAMVRHRFYKNDGSLNSGGKVYVYEAGTSTPKDSYTDSTAGTPNANPVILNSKGEADIWLVGLNKVNVTESDDTQVTGFPVDNVGASVSNNDAQMRWSGTAGGTANALTISPSPSVTGYVAGQSFVFKAGASNNSGATTIAVSGQAAIAVQSNGAACTGGEILANKFYMVLFDTTTTCQISKVGEPTVAEMGAAALTGATFTGDITMSGASIFDANASVAAHATTCDPWSLGNYVTLTGGAVTFTAMANAPQAGAEVEIYMNAAHVFTDGAVFEVDGDANYTATIGDRVLLRAKSTTVFTVHPRKKDGTAVVGGAVVGIQPISASVAANALTISASALSLDFRSATLGSGTVTNVSGTPSNLVISSGSTLGATSAVQSRIAVLAINNAGTIELAVVNISGGNDLTETGLISTTAEGGAGGADTANVIYSTTARSNVAYRVIGYIESTQATAGTWATAPSTIQGAGGNALTAMSSLGYGQTYAQVTRTSGTTYYNTSGRPKLVIAKQTASGANNGSLSVTVNGTVVIQHDMYVSGTGQINSVMALIPPNASYVVTNAGHTMNDCFELG